MLRTFLIGCLLASFALGQAVNPGDAAMMGVPIIGPSCLVMGAGA
ncbi:hypothetical protein [Jannaschia pohangensis]|uniref:Uncharacterized protein n=1 Tax=Jannaschia pohangensis TaxID=390807 RepID=A0A1I3MLC3_9RHOB|nr:hypothetical protein [Jannaschia pohangensis]SFI97769.1 hypothetical protein SAMN04488095_1887 [Jannaschia pohangensis]